jgi:hypothetical protein
MIHSVLKPDGWRLGEIYAVRAVFADDPANAISPIGNTQMLCC